MKKIFIDKNESIGEVVEKMASSGESDVVLVIPRNAKVRDSVNNFQLLKREAGGAKKTLVIESVDEEVLSLAETAGLEAVHPLFSGGRSRALTDILPSSGVVADEAPARRGKKAAVKKGGKKAPAKAGRKISLKVPPSPPAEEFEPVQEEIAEGVYEEPAYEEDAEVPAHHAYPAPEEEEERPRRLRWVGVLVALALLFGGGVLATNAFFSRADVAINFKQIPWQFENEVTASKEAAGTDAERLVIPGEVFRDERNLTQLFKASGRDQVSQKASGKIVIVNAYSAQPQTLVATTRFETPDGKIFRLDRQVVIPGAQVKSGTVTPSSIEATVTADQSGPDYNVGPVEKLTIPGFKGTPRFEGFYGRLPEGTQNGAIGERAVPTDADVEEARAKTSEILKSSLQSNLLNKRPSDFKIIDGTSEVEIVRLAVNRATDDSGNFSVFGEARFQGIGFREADVKALLTEIAQKDHAGYVFRDLTLAYENPQADYAAGTLSFDLKAQGALVPDFKLDEFRESVAGEEVEAARASILKLEGLSDAKISLWPLWLRSLPEDPDRVRVNVNYE